MIKVDGTMVLEGAYAHEARSYHNLQWVNTVNVMIPKETHTFEQAIKAVKYAKAISDTTDEAITTYYTNGMYTAKEDDMYTQVWLFAPNIVREENLATRVSSLEQTVDTILGGEEDV